MVTRAVLAPLAVMLLVACGNDVREEERSGMPTVESLSDATVAADGPTEPVDGGETASCFERYDSAAVARRAFAFDGTITKIRPVPRTMVGEAVLDTVAVTFSVNEWLRGGRASTVTVQMYPPAGIRSSSAESPIYNIGTRLLVSGEPRWGGGPLDEPIAWSCGFTRNYDPTTANAWRRATR